MKKWICGILAMLIALSLCGCTQDSAQQSTDPEPAPKAERPGFTGLVLKAAQDVKVELHTAFADGIHVAPTETYSYENEEYYCYSGLMGAYRYKVSGKGYYTVTKNLVVTQEDNEKETLIDVTPGKMSGSGWEPAAFSGYTRQLLEGSYNSDLSQWPKYAELMASPWFTQEHAAHQITTQSQMEEYLKKLDDTNDSMYLYSAGVSTQYQHDIPIAIFTQTDLSAATNVDAAAALLDPQKPLILYRAQMHGNEPAGGEAALAMIGWLDGKLGEELLGQVDICVIPRQSPDGAHNYERTIMDGIDPNRDSLRLQTGEITEFTRVANLLEPELIIDGHEYNAQVSNQTMGSGELLVGVGYTNDNTQQFQELGLAFADVAFDAVAENGMDYRYYTNYVNSVNASVSRCYWSMKGTQFILLETRGIGCGLEMYERRIVCHMIATEALLRYAAENADDLIATVDQERQSIVYAGGIYREDNQVVLDYTAIEDPTLQHSGRKHDQLTGTGTETVCIPKVFNQVNRSRIAPTAYVIPAGEGFTENVLKLMDKHGISYTFLPAGSRVRLQQYTGTVTNVALTGETMVSFPNGAYVFCRNQVNGLLLSMLMEPDVDDVAEQKSTLAQSRLIWARDDKFPIYRYIHDLNSEGFIDYQ